MSKITQKSKSSIKKAVIYARFSCDKQRDESIEDQIRVCSEYASARKIKIVGQYCDFAISGRTDHRPQFQQMIQDAATGDFDAVIIYKTDRFARNRWDSAIYKKQLAENGVRVLSATEDIPDGGGGILIESMYESMAELYSIQISQNVKRATRGNALKSKSNGGITLFGYKVNPVSRQYEINELEAPILQNIFRMAAEGKALKSIVDYANDAYPTVKFGYCKIKTILRNERYTGVYIYDGIRNEGGMPKLVDKSTFDAVQRFFTIRKPNGMTSFQYYPRQKYLFSRRAFCGFCGSKMTGEVCKNGQGKRYHYYACLGHKMHTSNCSCRKRVRADIVEHAAIGAVLEVLLYPEILQAISKAAQKVQLESFNQKDYRVEAQRQQLAEVRARKENLLNAIEAGIITDSTKERLKALESQEVFLQENITAHSETKDFTAISQMQYEFFLEQLKKGKINSEVFVKSVFRELISQIFIWNDHILLVYNLQKDVRDTVSTNIFELSKPIEKPQKPCPAYKKSSELEKVRSSISWLPE